MHVRHDLVARQAFDVATIPTAYLVGILRYLRWYCDAADIALVPAFVDELDDVMRPQILLIPIVSQQSLERLLDRLLDKECGISDLRGTTVLADDIEVNKGLRLS